MPTLYTHNPLVPCSTHGRPTNYSDLKSKGWPWAGPLFVMVSSAVCDKIVASSFFAHLQPSIDDAMLSGLRTRLSAQDRAVLLADASLAPALKLSSLHIRDIALVISRTLSLMCHNVGIPKVAIFSIRRDFFGNVLWQLHKLMDQLRPRRGIRMKYEKGENRRKHLGSELEAQVVFEHGVFVGKCPKGFAISQALKLVEDGVPEFRLTAPEKPFRIWSYFQGAIYAARSQDGGETWHGYPCPTEDIPTRILRVLEERANALNEGALIKQWLKKRWNK